MTPTPRRLQEALAQSEAGSALLHRYRASQRAASVIEAECQRIVPDFRPTQSGGCELRGTTLRLNATRPAQVAKLRQAVPSLLRLLQQTGLDVIEIKIRVQPRALTSSVRRQASLPISGAGNGVEAGGMWQSQTNEALAFARKLALTLPDSPLRAAARRLASLLSGRLAQMRDSGEPGRQQDGEKHNA
jgi:hypothetical protein